MHTFSFWIQYVKQRSRSTLLKMFETLIILQKLNIWSCYLGEYFMNDIDNPFALEYNRLFFRQLATI